MANRRAQMEELLERQGNLYTFDDIMERIRDGRMQSFAEGDTWVVTQVHVFPRKKVVDIVFVLGDYPDLSVIEPRVIEFAKRIEADLLMATGRLGWLRKPLDGWEAMTINFVKRV